MMIHFGEWNHDSFHSTIMGFTITNQGPTWLTRVPFSIIGLKLIRGVLIRQRGGVNKGIIP